MNKLILNILVIKNSNYMRKNNKIKNILKQNNITNAKKYDKKVEQCEFMCKYSNYETKS